MVIILLDDDAIVLLSETEEGLQINFTLVLVIICTRISEQHLTTYR